MAKATSKMALSDKYEEVKRKRRTQELQNMAADHSEDLRQLLELVSILREKGLLEVATAFLEQGHDLLEIAVNQANRQETSAVLKNGIALMQGFSKLDPALLTAAFGGLSEASERIADGEDSKVTDIWDMLKVMKDPDVLRGASAFLTILQSFGKHLRAADIQAEP